MNYFLNYKDSDFLKNKGGTDKIFLLISRNTKFSFYTI